MRKKRMHLRRFLVPLVLVGLGGGGYLAWHRGWLPFELTRAETGALLNSPDEAALVQFGNEDSDGQLGGVSIFGDDPNAESMHLVPSQDEPGDAVTIQDPFLDQSSDLAPSFEAAGRPGANSVASRDQPTVFAANEFQPFTSRSDGGEFFGEKPQPRVGQTPPTSPPRTNFESELGNSGAISRPAASRAPTAADQASVPQPVSPKLNSQIEQVDGLIRQNNFLKAHELLSTVFWNHPEGRAAIESRISKTAYGIYLAPEPHYLKPYVVQVGDNLGDIAKKYSVPWQYLKKLNRIRDPRSIQPGQRLKVIRGPFSAVVDLSDFEMIIHAHGYFVHRFRIGIGRDGASPVGKFKVINKVENPTYFGTDGSVIAADDPRNPVGEHWIDLGNSYGIHGTINPNSIGKAMSKGCIRLTNQDVAEVFGLLGIDSEVRIQE